MLADLCRASAKRVINSDFCTFLPEKDFSSRLRRPPLAATHATRDLIETRPQGFRPRPPHSVSSSSRWSKGFDFFVDKLAITVDTLEDQIIGGSLAGVRRNLSELRRTRVRLYRHISGLRVLFRRLERDRDKDLEEESETVAQPEFAISNQLLQRVDQLDHDVSVLGERTRMLQDEVAALRTEETNRHLRVLSILTIVFMPPTFIAGLLGMNLKGIPSQTAIMVSGRGPPSPFSPPSSSSGSCAASASSTRTIGISPFPLFMDKGVMDDLVLRTTPLR